MTNNIVKIIASGTGVEPLTIVPLTNPILDRLNELTKLKADWDSYGAQPISNTALVYALGILQITKGNLSQEEEKFESFFIAPIADGGLQIEWSRQGHELEVEITSEGVLGYLLKIKQEEAQTIEEKSEISLDVVLNVNYRTPTLRIWCGLERVC